MRIRIVILALFLAAPALALEPEPDAVFVRVIDTGAGHAAVAEVSAPAWEEVAA